MPFEYRLRESDRARRIRLRVTPEQGLEVVVPSGYPVSRIPRLLEQKQRWILAALERAREQRLLSGGDGPWAAPAHIVFPAVNKQWQVDAVETPVASVVVRATGESLLQMRGRIGDEKACRIVLSRWLVRQAQEHLPQRLHEIACQTGLRYRYIQIRRQKTRWASCSRDKDISLNAKLLFLPSSLADYVLLHELCHTVEMNHSSRFWSLVERHCSDYRQRDAMLRDMWYRVPRWAR